MSSRFYTRFAPPPVLAPAPAVDAKPVPKRKPPAAVSTQAPPPPKRQKFRDSTSTAADPVTTEPAKHHTVLAKLRKVESKLSQAPAIPTSEDPAQAPDAVQGLTPLPQPEEAKPTGPSNTSALPGWLAAPMVVPPDTTVAFADIPGLSPKLISRLSFPSAFAVQAALIPLLLCGSGAGGDVCVSAATGSGKTLAYALPIVQSLANCTVTRLRAVVILPTRELVAQVAAVFSMISGKVKIGVASGSKPLTVEQKMLVSSPAEGEGGRSKVDVLVTTPGRLVEHVRATPGFTLEYLRWVVADEADRLLAQSFQEWVSVLSPSVSERAGTTEKDGIERVLSDLAVPPRTKPRVRKVVLSATMTRDVGKLAELKLYRPTLVLVSHDIAATTTTNGGPEESFAVPPELKEFVLPIPSAEMELKPLYLLYLLRARGARGTVVFVKSNESAARLSTLLETFLQKVSEGWTVGLVTGDMERKRREKILSKFKTERVDMYPSPPLFFNLFPPFF